MKTLQKSKQQQKNGKLVFQPIRGAEIVLEEDKSFSLLHYFKKKYEKEPCFSKSKGSLIIKSLYKKKLKPFREETDNYSDYIRNN